MLHEQKLQSLHCRDRRVESTKLNWSTVLVSAPVTEWLFKYSVSKPPKVSWILSLLVIFVEKFWNHSVNVNLVSLLEISFHSIWTQSVAIFRVASEDMLYKATQGGRWIAITKTFAAVLSRNRFETYVFKLHILNFNRETRRMRHSLAPWALLRTYRVFSLYVCHHFFSWSVKAQVTFKERFQGE